MNLDHRLPDGTVPVLVSANTADLLRADVAALLRYAVDHPEISPTTFCDTLFRTRAIRRHRMVAMVRDRDELLGAWQAVLDGREHPAVLSGAAGTGRVGLVFPGQGGQRPGMGRLYYDRVPAYRAEADRCAAAFAALGGTPLRYLLDGDCPDTGRAGLVQPALFTQMAALTAMWRAFGIEPVTVIGHSQGEIAAAHAAGAVTLDDAARAVLIRAAAVDAAATDDFAMAVIAAGRADCEQELSRYPGWAEVSVLNSPTLTGVSGDRDTVAAVVETFSATGTFTRLLRVGYPAHTSWIDGLAPRVSGLLSAALEQPRFADTAVRWFGGTLGGRVAPALPAAQYWLDNLRNTVRFGEAVTAAVADRVSALVELSDHPVLELAITENLSAIGAQIPVIGTSERTATDLGPFSRNLARLALHLPGFEWGVLATGSSTPPAAPPADFPNTAMNPVSLWLPYDCGRPAPVAAPTPQLLVERWDRLTRRSMVAPHSFGVLDYAGGSPELAAALCHAAADLGGTGCIIDSDTAATDHTALVVLLPPVTDEDLAAAADRVAAFFVDRPWAAGLGTGVTDCWLVTVGGEPAGGVVSCPAAAGVAAGFRGVGAEYPQVAFRHLDLPAGPVDPVLVIAALQTAGETELALRDDALYAKRLAAPDSEPSTAAVPGHVLILGGTGNLGLEFCAHFARGGARWVTLVSRGGTVTDRVAALRTETATVIDAVACDITDPVAVAALADRMRDDPADLVVHAAMAYRDLDSTDVTAADAAVVLQTKATGAQHIINTVPRTPEGRVLLCSSAAATIGGRGQVLYAAANRMLDAYAEQLRADGVNCAAVQWGQWSTLDLTPEGFAKLAATGLLPMRPADALAVGLNDLRCNTVVAAFDLDRARPVLSAFGYGPLLSELDSPASTTPTPLPPDGISAEQRLLQLLAGAIGVADPAELDTGAPLVAIGLDSVQALELHRQVKAEFDHDLAVADLLGGASIADVLSRLATGGSDG